MKAPTSERGYLSHSSQSPLGNFQQQRRQQQVDQQQGGYAQTAQVQPVGQMVQPQEQQVQPHQPEAHYAPDYAPQGEGAAGAGLEPAPNESGATTVEQTGGGGGSGTALVGSSSGLQTRADLPAVRALNVKCEKNHMTVNIVFDRPFYGMVFSKGHYNDQKCVHLPANSGQTSANFDIHLGKCGMSSSDANGGAVALNGAQGTQLQAASGGGGTNGQQPNGLYIENVIIIQYDPQVQEIYDQARKLRCTWYDYYEKSVTFRPYNVDMLDAVTANFLGDNIQCWMQIQVGKGPWSSEVAGIVKIGQTMTMVLAIKDDENRFDMLVRNCVAHDGKHQPIQLVDEYGCVARPKIMAKFQKVRNFGPAATVVSYAHFQAFKFPDSMSVHFQCVIQVCRYECPEPVCSASQSGGGGLDPPGLSSSSTGGSSGGSGNNGGGASDYAASGTEIVASKEPMPMMGIGSGGGGEQSAVNLKLDEHQGRVQVKLDTSMMAGIGGGQQMGARGQQGPLPPHLLHLGAGGEPMLSRPSYLSAAAAAGTPVGRGGHTFQSSSSAAGGFQRLSSASGTPAPPGGGGASNAGRPAMLNGSGRAQLAPPSHQQTHYSAPFPASQQQQTPQQVAGYRASTSNTAYTATNRVGELALSELELDSSRTSTGQPVPLLGGSPRALRLAPATAAPANLSRAPAPNHRYKRFAPDKRLAGLVPDFTDVQTQKTIQVVSPDDVAFSLLSDDLEPPLTISGSSNRPQRISPVSEQHLSNVSTVCFSAARLMAGLLVALAALAASVAVVSTLLIRHRWQRNLAAKLSPVYELDSDTHLSAGDLSAAAATTSSTGGAQVMPATQQQQQQFTVHHHSQQHQKHQRLLISRRLEEEAMMSRCRQRDEIQQRNNYLARLYSQFVPASYWR